MSCDIFICYRRKDDAYFAQLLAEMLQNKQYDVFLDVTRRKSGKFSPVLIQNIVDCTDFILVVTKETFGNRIYENDDFVFNEIKTAIDNSKNIIPIFVDIDKFPKNIPLPIIDIVNYQAMHVHAAMVQEAFNTLCKDFLKSKPNENLNGYELAKIRCSIYDASYEGEKERLSIQGNNSLLNDIDVLNKILNDTQLTVLDVGCAYGNVGLSRFNDKRFEKVIGVDNNLDCIAYANCNNPNKQKFFYEKIDIESSDFDEKMGNIVNIHKTNGFDVVYIALTLHHLNDPVKFLRKIRRYINKEGYIIIRGSDDQCKICYSGYEESESLLLKIIQKTANQIHISDRYNGRKIYHWLEQAGFENNKIYSYMIDTSNMKFEQKENLFTAAFSYRINSFKKELESDLSNEEKQRSFYEMEKMLYTFEHQFYSAGFWYCQYDLIGVGRK